MIIKVSWLVKYKYAFIAPLIYHIKTRLKYVYMCIYMFVCTEMIEETGRSPGMIFGMCDILAWVGQVRVLEINSHLTERGLLKR